MTKHALSCASFICIPDTNLPDPAKCGGDDDKVEAEINTQNGNNDSQSGSKTCSSTMTTTTTNTTQQPTNPFIKSKFVTSDNSFKFNFAVNCD